MSTEKPQLLLLLGCFGRSDNGFVSCRGCENCILKMNERIYHYNEMMDYFDTCRLFDKRIYEQSAIRHFLYNMQERFDQVAVGKPLWSVAEYNLYEKFVVEHRHCGCYIRLDFKDEVEEKPLEEKSVLIQATTKLIQDEVPKVNLKLIFIFNIQLVYRGVGVLGFWGFGEMCIRDSY